MKVKDLRGFPKQRENLALTELGNRQALGFNQALDIVGELEIKVPKKYIKEHYDEFLGYYYNAPCEGCGHHSSFWRTITTSQEWKDWDNSDPHYDLPECEALGIMGKKHWEDFVKFISNSRLP